MDAHDHVCAWLSVDLNVMSWSTATNMLALALDKAVFLWNAGTGSITELCVLSSLTGGSADDDYQSCVSFMPAGSDTSVLALGNTRGDVQVTSVILLLQVRSTQPGHSG